MPLAIASGAALPPPRTAVLRNILALAAPTGLLAGLQVVAQLFEVWLASRQGVLAFAGWAIVLPFAQLMQQMSTGAMGGGVSASIARALGAGKPDEASALVLHALLIALAGSALFAVPLAIFPHQVLGAIGGAEVAAAAAGYAICLFGAGAAPVWLANTLASVLRGGERHALAAGLVASAWLSFPLLAWVLSEWAGLGLVGIAAAFASVYWVVAIAMIVVVLRGAAGFVPHLRGRPRRDLFARILSVGLVACLISLLFNLATIGVTMQLAAYGTAAIAAFGIAARLEFLIVPLVFGIGSALTAMVGRAVGARDWSAARRIAWTGGFFAMVVAGLAGMAVALAPVSFAGLFADDPQLRANAAQVLRYTAPAFGVFGLGLALYFASMGAGSMRWPLAAGLSRVLISVGGGWMLANPVGMGVEGYFLGMALGACAYGLFNVMGMRSRAWHPD